jgi:hypothetical protein
MVCYREGKGEQREMQRRVKERREEEREQMLRRNRMRRQWFERNRGTEREVKEAEGRS